LFFCSFVLLFFCLSVSVISNNVEAEGIKIINENKISLYEEHLGDGKSIKSKLTWPLVDHPETRPWTWWWWHGCAVTKADITTNLEALHRSGLGGVNIVCLLDVREARFGKGRIFLGGTADQVLAIAGIKREKLFDSALRCIRRIDNEGTTYFVVNPAGNIPFDGWLPLNAKGANVAIFDPMDSISGIAKQRKSVDGGTEVYLQLQPRESCILRVLRKPVNAPAWRYFDAINQQLAIQGPWQVKFIDGGEIIPHPETIDKLDSWTTWNSDQKSALCGFSGTACYTTHFMKPSTKADDWIIEPGNVLHTARIRLNGILLADRFTTPMQVFTGSALQEGDNLLEIEVSNTPINRAADLEIKGIQWQKCLSEDNNKFVIGDFLFPWKKKEAATWKPRPSGLMGPVRLMPVKMKEM